MVITRLCITSASIHNTRYVHLSVRYRTQVNIRVTKLNSQIFCVHDDSLNQRQKLAIAWQGSVWITKD